jgi:pimeloyl-ACP methyl ester carboxylesterase
MLRALTLVATVTLLACSSASTAALPGSAIDLAECRVRGYDGPARCGTYEVWENRTAKSGRRIPLHIVVIPARGPGARQPDPVFYFDGGPGSSASGAVGWVTRLLRDVHVARDLVFVDVRGTGRSAPLRCPGPDPDGPLQAYFDGFLADDAVRACLAQLDADVRFYTQPIAMDDVDEVRAALGYQQINLFGTSGGTRQAQLYVRRHGASVRSVVMQGVAPMDGEMPRAFARAMEAGLRALIDGCAADPVCRAAHPALGAQWEQVRQRFDAGPVRTTVRHPRTGRDEHITISRGVFADGLRHMLYNLQAVRALPGRIEAAARGDFEPFAHAYVQHETRLADGIATGFFLSSTCAEDVRFIDEDDIQAASAGTFLGDYRMRRQQAACRIWPRGEGIDADFQQPVQSDRPVLALSGDADVATPANDAERAIRRMPNARHVVFRNQGHALRDPACAARIITAFVEAADVKGLDISCAETPSPGP